MKHTLWGTILGIVGAILIINTVGANVCRSTGACGMGICLLGWYILGLPLGILMGNILVSYLRSSNP